MACDITGGYGLKTCHFSEARGEYCSGAEACVLQGCRDDHHYSNGICVPNIQPCSNHLSGGDIGGDAIYNVDSGAWNFAGCFSLLPHEGAEVNGSGNMRCGWTSGTGGGAIFEENCQFFISACNAGFYRATENAESCTPVGTGWFSPANDWQRSECPHNGSTETTTSSAITQCFRVCTPPSPLPAYSISMVAVNAREFYLLVTGYPECRFNITCAHRFSPVNNGSPTPICVRTQSPVSFSGNAVAAVGTMGELDCQIGEACYLPANTLMHAGHVFDEWCTEFDGDGACVPDQGDVSGLITVATAELSLYAQWDVCHNGRFSTEENSSGADCQICPAGTSTPNDGQAHSSCIPCLAGTFQPNAESSGCNTCPAGHFCPTGSINPRPCPDNHACLTPGLGEPVCSGYLVLMIVGENRVCVATTGEACTVGDHGHGEISAITGLCILQRCDDGFHMSADAVRCSPNIAPCTTQHGRGTQEWNEERREFGRCVESSCNIGFGFDHRGVCVACGMPNVLAFRQDDRGRCLIELCRTGHHLGNDDNDDQGEDHDGRTCMPNVRTCDVVNGTGQEVWSNGVWGECEITDCDIGFHAEGGVCAVSVRPCTVENGTGGTERWIGNRRGDGFWGECEGFTCNIGFTSNRSLTNDLTALCGRCHNAYSHFNGELDPSAVVHWGTGECEIVSCRHQNQMYRLDNNECVAICEGTIDNKFYDGTGYMWFDPIRGECMLECASNEFTPW